MIFFYGCAGHDMSEIDQQLAQKDSTYIYDIELDNIIEPVDEQSSVFDEFPFITEKPRRYYKGRFPSEFYKQNGVDLRSSSLDKVDLWSLELHPERLDVIYTNPIWIEDYKNISDDLFVNICYTYNLSDKQQNILKIWIENGGIFWIENGIYATGNELNSRKKIPKKQHFLGLNVRSSHYNLTDRTHSTVILFNHLQTSKGFENIHALQLNLDRSAQTFFIIEGEDLIREKSGKVLLSSANYGKGKIISMLPFESYDAYRDGEMLRWNLLKVLTKKVLVDEQELEELTVQTESLKTDETVDVKVKKVVKIEPVQVASVIQEGRCIQLFSGTSKSDSLEKIKKATTYPLARIEKRGIYYIGRVGMYSSYKEAKMDLIPLKRSYRDAFIRTCKMRIEDKKD